MSPKTNLFIFLVISSALLILWRLFLFPLLGFKKHQKAVLIGAKKEMRELYEEVNQNPRYDIQFVDFIDTGSRNPNEVQQQALKRVMVDGVGVVVTDLGDKNLDALGPLLYNLSLTQSRVHLVDFGNFYTDVFGRIPVGVVSPEWLIKHLHSERHIAYMVGKRIIDVGGAVVLGIFSLILFPFIAIAIKMDDGGPLFIAQERVGYGGSRIRIYKFRTMTGTTSDEGTEVLKSEKKITRVGAFLRKTRLDELPQLYSVLVGDQSLVGPRPELPALVEVYAQKVPHYSARHMVPPGLSGWAQIHHQAHPHHGTDVYETMQKISYDLYYVKNRSLFLDFFIALRTVYILLSRVGK